VFLGTLARLADPIDGCVLAHPPTELPSTRAQRRATRTRRQVLRSYARQL
jgi:hypothetical protein